MNMVLEPKENFLIAPRRRQGDGPSRPGQPDSGRHDQRLGRTRSVTAGNPNLDPFRAKAYDLSFEWYFNAKSSLLSLACSRRTSTASSRRCRPTPVYR
jgi:iron complex outermembrane receptor protein